METLFSPAEKEILKILGRRKMTITELADKYYAGKPAVDANNRVATIVTRINKKCSFHKLDWTLRGEGTGRHGKKIWRIKK